jgi:hypothetical protein
VLLTADRQPFTDRAVKCFLSQTYENKYLLIYDTGVEPWKLGPHCANEQNMRYVHDEANGRRIGALRNAANSMVSADVIAHWDSDDWSAPERLAVQIDMLQSVEATGFSDMVIADTRASRWAPGAWAYTYRLPGRVLGSSLCYSRRVWAASHFHEGKTEGEETHWPTQTGVHAVTSFQLSHSEPLMVAEYHGGNTGGYGKADNCPVIFDQTPAQLAQNPQWRRVPDWDAFCGKVLYP